jgi:hypothetical protein
VKVSTSVPVTVDPEFMTVDRTKRASPFVPGFTAQVTVEVVPSEPVATPREPESPTLADDGNTILVVGVYVTPVLEIDLYGLLSEERKYPVDVLLAELPPASCSVTNDVRAVTFNESITVGPSA